MPTGATGQLGLALPVQGELSGTWGNTVNNAITEYTNIAIAATLTLTNDGAVTLANTTGTDLATNITSSLTGAGTVTAQFAIVRVTGTLTTAKVVTAPSYSKTYTVVNAATGGIVTFKASGQTGVSIAVGESAFVYFNGTDYVKVSGTSAVSSFTAGTTGFTPSSATTGAVTLAGTLATTNGGTGLTSFTSGGVVYASSSSALATGSALKFDGANLGVGVTPSAWRATNPAFQIAQAGCLFGYASSTITVLGSNTLLDATGNEKYIVNGTATAYQQNNSGQHIWYQAASGTAGNAVTFTQAMTLDADGDLGIGTTTPANKLTVAVVGNATLNTPAAHIAIFNSNDAVNNQYYGLAFTNSNTPEGGVQKPQALISCISGGGSWTSNWAGDLVFATAPGGATAAPTEKIRINASGTFILKNDYQEQTYTANSSTAITLNITTNGTDQVITLTGTATITMPTATAGKSFLLKLKTGAGGYTVTWSTVKWPGGTAPTLTSTASRMDIFSFFSDGTNWYGTTVGQNYTP